MSWRRIVAQAATRPWGPHRPAASAPKLGLVRNDAAHQAVLHRLFGGQPAITLDVAQHLVERASGLARDGAGDAFSGLDDLLRVDRDIGRLSAGAAAGLVDQEACVGQAVAP